MSEAIKVITLIFFSSFKFAFAFPYALTLSLGYIEIISCTVVGGMLGVVFFSKFNIWIIGLWSRFFPSTKNKKIFSRRNRLVIKVWRKYGLFGIAFLTPILLSIPIGTFIAVRYKESMKKIYLFMGCSVVFWSILLTGLMKFFGIVLFE